jgi:hypothetical protein
MEIPIAGDIGGRDFHFGLAGGWVREAGLLN